MKVIIELDYDKTKGMVQNLIIKHGDKKLVVGDELRVAKALEKIENVLVWSEGK